MDNHKPDFADRDKVKRQKTGQMDSRLRSNDSDEEEGGVSLIHHEGEHFLNPIGQKHE